MNPINTSRPGRMAPATALGFGMPGLSLLFLASRRHGSHWFAAIGMILGLMAALSYVFGAEPRYGFRHYSAMAIHTALAFMLINISVLLARPRMGYVDTLASDSLGGFVARELKKMDLKRREADNQILELNAKLESRIRERTAELQNALDDIRRLEGFLPICAWCKNIRDDKNYWTSVEDYVSQRTDAHFSHGICPDCLAGEQSLLGVAANFPT